MKYHCSFLLAPLLVFLLGSIQLLADESQRPGSDRSLVIELTAYGRGGHGSSLNRSSAPHRIIRALSRMEALIDSRSDAEAADFTSRSIEGFAIQSVSSGEKINVTPDQAFAQLLLTLSPGAKIIDLEKVLSEMLTNSVEFKIIVPHSSGRESP